MTANVSSTHDTGDVVARVRLSATVEVEHPATAGSVVNWVRERLEDMGCDDILTVVEEP